MDQYLFFVANVTSRQLIDMGKDYYLKCLQELLKNSSNYLKMNENLIQRVQLHRGAVSQVNVDKNKTTFLAENSLTALLELCEPLQDEEVDQLLEYGKQSKFNHLMVKLLEKKENYSECLRLYVEGMQNIEYQTNSKEISKIFEWIQTILCLLQAKRTVQDS